MTADETRLKRLKIRAWRRGIKEMDLIMGRFVEDTGAEMTAAEMDALEALMEENDLDIYSWITGRDTPPEAHAATIARLTAHATAS